MSCSYCCQDSFHIDQGDLDYNHNQGCWVSSSFSQNVVEDHVGYSGQTVRIVYPDHVSFFVSSKVPITYQFCC